MIKHTLAWLCLFIAVNSHAQINFSANEVVPPYDGKFRYGSNLGNYPPWSNEELADISAGNPALGLEGIGVQSFRPALQEEFLEAWGYDIRQPDFQHWYNLNIRDNVAFIGYPSAAHRDPETYCGTEQSRLFANMYEPIWDNGANGTPVNDENYYALYVYKIATEYSQFVTFWEIWNEPDLSQAAASWLPPNDPNSWWQTDPSPCDYDLHAPIYHYVRLLRISYEVLKYVDDKNYVCIGGIGSPSFLDAVIRNTDNPGGGWVNNDYPLKGGAYFDVVSFHSYPHIDASMWEFPPTGGIVYHRHSDRGIDGFIGRYNALEAVMNNRGYNGTTYPEKLWIVTETMLPRKEYSGYIGSVEAQVNYLIKSFVEAQKTKILQVDLYTISELTTEEDAWNEYQLMGLFKNLSEYSAHEYELTDAGVAFHTMTTLLQGKTYDANKTAQMNIPASANGAAFQDNDGSHVFVLWAKTSIDMSEAASTTYSFPGSFGLSEVTVWDWDFSKTANVEVHSPQNLLLSGSPIFIKAGSHLNTPPVAAFEADPMEGCEPFTVTFNDVSGGNPNAWSWSFPGGNPSSSTLQNPSVTYTSSGTYDVSLTASNDFGENTVSSNGLIVVEPLPAASFDYEVQNNDLTIIFTNTSNHGTSYKWQFGDGGMSSEENPTHTYSGEGTYSIILEVTNDCGTETFQQTVMLETSSLFDNSEIERFEVFPNPTDGHFSVIVEGETLTTLQLSLHNILGQEVFTETLQSNGGKHYRTFDGVKYSKGIYILRVDFGGKSAQKRVVIN